MSEHEDFSHSRFGGSSALRWLNCAGSVALNDTIPPMPSSKYAEEGTLAHALGDICLKNGDRTSFGYRTQPFHWKDHGVAKVCEALTYEMCQAVDVYLKAVFDELDRTPDAELFVEARFVLPVDGSDGKEVFGANDALVYHPSLGRLVVFDYKHGVGQSVNPDDNAQLKFYACGAVISNPQWTLKEIELVVVQPRAHDAAEVGQVKVWPMDTFILLDFLSEVEAAVKLAKAVKLSRDGGSTITFDKAIGGLVPHFKRGYWCEKSYCPAFSTGKCPAVEAEALHDMQIDLDGVADVMPAMLPKTDEIDVDRIAGILRGADIIAKWASQVYAHAEGMLLQGQTVPGFKLVEKVSRRKWTGADEEIAAYLTMIYGLDEATVMPRKLATITEVEKQIKAAGVDFAAAKEDITLRFTVKESSGYAMAPASDKRDAVNAIATDLASVNLN